MTKALAAYGMSEWRKTRLEIERTDYRDFSKWEMMVVCSGMEKSKQI